MHSTIHWKLHIDKILIMMRISSQSWNPTRLIYYQRGTPCETNRRNALCGQTLFGSHFCQKSFKMHSTIHWKVLIDKILIIMRTGSQSWNPTRLKYYQRGTPCETNRRNALCGRTLFGSHFVQRLFKMHSTIHWKKRIDKILIIMRTSSQSWNPTRLKYYQRGTPYRRNALCEQTLFGSHFFRSHSKCILQFIEQNVSTKYWS